MSESPLIQKKLSDNFYEKILKYSYDAFVVIDNEGNIKFVSKSVRKLLGIAPGELTNTQSFMKFVDNEYKPYLVKFLRTMLLNPRKKVKTTLKYFRRDNKWIFLELTGINFIDDDVINGFLIIMRNVSYKATIERLERNIQKWRSITDHLQEVIIRIDKNKRILFLNPRLSFYWQGTILDYINKKLDDLPFYTGEVKDILDKLIYYVFAELREKNIEQTLYTLNGSKDFNIVLIPEQFAGKVETMLIIFHDITEIKEAQRQIERLYEQISIQKEELEQKNKDIMDSIRYAQRIQRSVLPTETEFRNAFKEHFIIYLPRDVVSGDFYWLYQDEINENIVWVAGADCTGHGVPGAFMSIIGNVLLNQLIKVERIKSPAKILRELDRKLIKMLSQDEKGSSQDGMDIALCKIDFSKNRLLFSGAKRPLILINDGVLKVIKGTRISVGGTLFKNRLNGSFTDYEIIFNEGDLIYMFSDGIIDQPGGKGGEKLKLRRFKDLLDKIKNLPLNQQKNLILEALAKWKGRNPQIDDILIIGLKL